MHFKNFEEGEGIEEFFWSGSWWERCGQFLEREGAHGF